MHQYLQKQKTKAKTKQKNGKYFEIPRPQNKNDILFQSVDFRMTTKTTKNKIEDKNKNKNNKIISSTRLIESII